MFAAFENLQARAVAKNVLESPVEAAGARVQHVQVPGQKLAILSSPVGAKSEGTVDDASREAWLQDGWNIIAETPNLRSLAVTPANAGVASESVSPRSEPARDGEILRVLAGLGLKSAMHVMTACGLPARPNHLRLACRSACTRRPPVTRLGLRSRRRTGIG